MPAEGVELRLYNTLTRSKEVFTPDNADMVKLYVCGPTVYDFAHIGNARPVIVFDLLFRLLRHIYGAEHVTYVRNITDVDDKINARALERFGKEIKAGRLDLNAAIRTVTEETARQFHEDVRALGCLEPTHEPRATDFILPRSDGRADMTSLIQTLIDRGNAYVATGGEGREILFDVASMPEYGGLSRRRLEDQQAGARVAVEAHKKNPADFVLWKESGHNEPGWDATFREKGTDHAIRGRPGWHIECSAMSAAYLGDIFDIHGGGIDLIFPHHENEIAQSRCAHETEIMANIWMHNGFLQVEGRKMSKSEGNFVTIHDLLHTDKLGGRKWPGEVLRLAMLMTHYREPIDFSISRLEEAENLIRGWAKLRKFFSDRNWVELNTTLSNPVPADTLRDLLKDDLNTVTMVQSLQSMARSVEQAIKIGNEADYDVGHRLLATIEWLGIDIANVVLELSLPEIEEALIHDNINRRLAFIADKNWAEADRIRDELLEQGIQLKDGKDPQTGERTTTYEVRR